MTNTTDPRTTAPAISIEYRDGTTKVKTFDSPADAEEFWDNLVDDGGALRLIQYAARSVPSSRNQAGYVVRAYYGTPAAEMPAPKTRAELDKERYDAEIAAGAARERELRLSLAADHRAARNRRRA